MKKNEAQIIDNQITENRRKSIFSSILNQFETPKMIFQMNTFSFYQIQYTEGDRIRFEPMKT